MPHLIDDQSLLDSYKSMVRSDLTDDQRQKLWDTAQDVMPDLAKVLLDRFNLAVESSDEHQVNRLTGAMFFFLAVVNSIEPIVIVDRISTVIPSHEPFPSFGKLPSL